MRRVAIVQARTGSTRLPGKVLKDLSGEPMLVHVLERLQRATTLDTVVVATTVEPADEAIVALCAHRGWLCYRGSTNDVLDRYYRAAEEHQADMVVRITSDCPMIDPGLVDLVVETLVEQPQLDYVSNVWPRRSFPRGLDCEALRFGVLERAWREDVNPSWREHVTPYIYENPQRFHIHGVNNQEDQSRMRWCVDTAKDWQLVSQIFEHFGHNRFTWRDVLQLLDQHPQWLTINQHVQQTTV